MRKTEEKEEGRVRSAVGLTQNKKSTSRDGLGPARSPSVMEKVWIC